MGYIPDKSNVKVFQNEKCQEHDIDKSDAVQWQNVNRFGVNQTILINTIKHRDGDTMTAIN